MADGNLFNGQFTRRPGVRAAVQASANVPLGNDPRIVVLIGQALGGQPQTILSFPTAQGGLPTLRGGDLLTALFRCMNPGTKGAGPSQVYVCRVNNATQASLTLPDVDGHPSILFSAQNWGAADNAISVVVGAGTNGGQKVTISNVPIAYVLDNLQRTSFTLQVVGAGVSAAVVNISGNTLTTTVTGGSGIPNLNINLLNYATLQALVTYINTQNGYTATMVYTNPNEPTTQLDSQGGVVAQYDEQYHVSILGAVFTDAGITASAAVLTSATANFTTADVGRTVVVAGAGVAGAALITTISAFTNSTTVTLTDDASTTVSGANLTIEGRAPFNVTTNLQAIVDAVNAGGQNLVTAQRAHGVEVTDGAMTASSATLTSVTAAFVAGDVGRQIVVGGAGAAGATLVTTIFAFTNSTTVTLATDALTSVTNADVTIAGGVAIPADESVDYLSGGSEGTFTNTDWTNCFNLFNNTEVSYFVPLTGMASVHGLLSNVINTVSATGENPQRAVVGGVLGEYTSTLTNYLNRAANLNTRRISCIPTGLNDIDDVTGNLTLYPPYIVAAQIAGLMCTTAEIGDSITHMPVRGLSLEWTPNAANLETLLAGGLLPLEFVAKGSYLRVTRGLTTWLQDNDLINTEMACVEDIDVLIADGYTALEPLVGKKGTPTYIGLVASAVQSWLMDEEDADIIVGDPTNGIPAFQNITVQVNGDTTTVSFEASIGAPQNFINVNASLNTYSGSITIATS